MVRNVAAVVLRLSLRRRRLFAILGGMDTQAPSPAIEGWPRIVLFGLNNATTIDILRRLLPLGVMPAVLILPDSAAPHLLPSGTAYVIAIPRTAPDVLLAPSTGGGLVEQAWAAGIPVWVVRDLADPAVTAALAKLRAEAGIVACFSRRIPPEVLALLPLGVLNLHPSLLPDYRGPAPLFWQYRLGESQFGMTVHLLDAGLDTGPILAQERIDLPRGIDAAMTTRLLNATGVRLMVEQLRLLAQGAAAPVAQSPGGSYFGWPEDGDFVIPAEWTAVRAYNFMRGTADWGRPYPVTIDGQTLRLAEALAHSDDTTGTGIQVRPNGDVWVPLAEGTLWARPVLGEVAAER